MRLSMNDQLKIDALEALDESPAFGEPFDFFSISHTLRREAGAGGELSDSEPPGEFSDSEASSHNSSNSDSDPDRFLRQFAATDLNDPTLPGGGAAATEAAAGAATPGAGGAPLAVVALPSPDDEMIVEEEDGFVFETGGVGAPLNAAGGGPVAAEGPGAAGGEDRLVVGGEGVDKEEEREATFELPRKTQFMRVVSLTSPSSLDPAGAEPRVNPHIYEGRPKGQNLWGKWRPGIAVMGHMGIILQLVDVIYPCSEG
jgi:hypothetical protein